LDVAQRNPGFDIGISSTRISLGFTQAAALNPILRMSFHCPQATMQPESFPLSSENHVCIGANHQVLHDHY
jgi:hypothetical protein